MSYNSKHTGAEVDALLDKAGTAVQPSSLATVATSGSYNDLSNKPTIPAEQVNADWNATSGKAQILNKPTIPSAVTENTVSGWGFTKNTGTYSKPSGGIPKSDLESSVQTSLGKADSALQSYTEQYKGTVTGVKINGSTKNPSNGVVDLGTVITSHQDISGKQDKLVSGSNIKTINGQSIVGSGDITISGGGEEYAEPYLVDYDGGGMGACFAIEDDINSPMLPDVTYICPVAVMVVWVQTLQPPTGNVGKYTFHFNVGNDGALVHIDESILMAGTRPETLEPNVSCELSIIATKIGNTYTYKAVLTSFS